MADYDNRVVRGGATTATVGLDAGLRSFMLRVYNYMLTGLVLTGFAAMGTYFLSVTDGNHLTQFGQLMFVSPLRWVFVIAPFLIVLGLSFGIERLSAGVAQMLFWAYSTLLGVSFGVLFLVYTSASIAQVFFITAAMFGAMSLYGYTTRRDLTGMGSFLMMGLFGLIIASLVGIFVHSSVLQFVISVAGVLIFTGLTAYDTQKIKEMYYVGDDGTVVGRKAVMAALSLYLDFINIFLMLLRLMGDRR